MTKRIDIIVYLKRVGPTEEHTTIALNMAIHDSAQLPTEEEARKALKGDYGIAFNSWELVGFESYGDYQRALDGGVFGSSTQFAKLRGRWLQKRRATHTHTNAGLARTETMYYVEGDPTPPEGTAFTVFYTAEDAARYALECMPDMKHEERLEKVKPLHVFLWG